jgi:LemA protein
MTMAETTPPLASTAGALGWGGMAWIMLLVVLALWMLGAHNRLTALRAAILAAWTPLDALLQARAEALTALLAEAETPLAAERAALDAVANAMAQLKTAADQVRRQALAAAAAAELAKADAVLVVVNQRFQALLSHHVELNARAAVRAQLATLAEQQPRLQFARQAFNDAAQRYNGALDQFPTRLLGPVLRFEPAGKL